MCASLKAADFAPFDIVAYDDLTLSDSEQPVDDDEAATDVFAHATSVLRSSSVQFFKPKVG